MVSSLFNIGLNGIKAAQIALEVAGNNVANAETPGYVRRSPMFKQLSSASSFFRGEGVTIEGIKRQYSRFTASSWRESLPSLGYHQIRKEILEQVEGIFNEVDGRGLNQALTEFWNAWEEVANDPTDLAIRENLIQKSQILVNNFHLKSERLSNIKESLTSEIKGVVKEANGLAQKIADLNCRIKVGQAARRDPNELLDERDELVRQLAQKVGATAFENDKGETTVLIGGQALVMGKSAFKLEASLDVDGRLKITWNGEVDITLQAEKAKGELGAYLELTNTVISAYNNDLDKLAYQLADNINSQHSSGWDLDGNPGADIFIFEPTLADLPHDAARYIKLNISDPKKIAAASSNLTLPGDNTNVLAILDLKDSSISGLDDRTFSSFYQEMISDVGSETHQAKTDFETQQMLVDDIKNYFDSVAGVNLDEEAANTLKFQYMYTASARLINVADEMLKTIVNLGA